MDARFRALVNGGRSKWPRGVDQRASELAHPLQGPQKDFSISSGTCLNSVKLRRTQYEHMFSALHLKLGHCSIPSAAQTSLGPRKTRLGATVCFSKLELTLHGSLVLSLAADVVVLPLHTRH